MKISTILMVSEILSNYAELIIIFKKKRKTYSVYLFFPVDRISSPFFFTNKNLGANYGKIYC